MRLMIFSPGKVSYGVANDDATNDELFDILYTAATKEQGNGKKSERKSEIEDSRRKSLGGENSK